MIKFDVKDFTTCFDSDSKENMSQRETYNQSCFDLELPKYISLAETLDVSVEELQYRSLRFMSNVLKSKVSKSDWNDSKSDTVPDESETLILTERDLGLNR